jgi:hypothetical protein
MVILLNSVYGAGENKGSSVKWMNETQKTFCGSMQGNVSAADEVLEF